MRKWISVLLAALLAAVAALPPSSLAEPTLSDLFRSTVAGSNPLDVSFVYGAVDFAPAVYPGLEAADRVEIPDALLTAFPDTDPEEIAAVAEAMLAAKDAIVLYDISPDGQSAIGELDGAPVAISGGAIRAIFPNAARGVADEYGKLSRLYGVSPSLWLGGEGVVWSPDGRYAAPTNVRMALYEGRFLLDPLLIDTQTGDIRQLFTSGEKANNGGAGVVGAAFSEDGQSVWYTLAGKPFDGRAALLRADVESGSVEVCHVLEEGVDVDSFPQLARLPDGRLASLTDSVDRQKPQGVAVYAPASGAYARDLVRLTCPAANVSCTLMRWSTKSNLGLALDYSLFTRLSFDGGLAGLDRFWGLDADTGELIEFAPEAVASYYRGMVNGDTLHLCEISQAALSPDGRYALITYFSDRTDGAMIVRLSDMASAKANGLPALRVSRANGRPNRLVWSEAGVLISTEDGGTRLFAIQ